VNTGELQPKLQPCRRHMAIHLSGRSGRLDLAPLMVRGCVLEAGRTHP
jgi:hypothetical protein